MKEEKGVRRTFWMPKELDEKAEEIRKKLGLGRSSFYKFAVVEQLKAMIAPEKQIEKTKAEGA